ncbi:MAG: KilA-N domain-containing protein [Clostridiales bacterium]|nr:KilA-N domain-containing protein [Clostridiales bacterium]
MVLEVHNDAITEYLDSIEQTIKELQDQSGMSNKTAEYTRQNAQKSIRKYLETNANYAQLLMDLEHIKYKDKVTYSLTDIAKRKDATNPSYIIQSWLRNVNTLELLCLWEKEHNFDFNFEEARKLIYKTKEPAFTLTAKIWISSTNAKGLVSKQGKGGGTFAHHEIAIDFITWLFPEKRYELSKMIMARSLMQKV